MQLVKVKYFNDLMLIKINKIKKTNIIFKIYHLENNP